MPDAPHLQTATVTTAVGPIPVHFTDQGNGHAFLLLHGGAGPASVAGFADQLAAAHPARVLTPTHPGFGGTPRPEGLASVPALAAVYVALLEELDLVDVTVIGNSLGGWTAAEMALLHSPRVSSVVIVDAVGLTSGTDPIVDFFSLTMDRVIDLSYHPAHRDRARAELEALPDVARPAMVGNRAALLTYGGPTMADPTLVERLPAVANPTLVVWGEADRIVAPSHARAYAAAIPGAELDLLAGAGHLPQLEVPEQLADAIGQFADRHATHRLPPAARRPDSPTRRRCPESSVLPTATRSEGSADWAQAERCPCRSSAP